MHRRGVAARFSRASESYTQAAEVQRKVVDELVSKLPECQPCCVLEIGCGTGMLTERLLQKYPSAEFDVVDIAEGMIDFCRNRLDGAAKVQWHACDILGFESDCKYDIIASSSAIHWVQDLDLLFRQLAESLSEDGAFIFSLMMENTFRELHEVKKKVLPEDKIGQRLPSFDEVVRSLGKAGLQVLKKEICRETVIYGSAAEFFESIRAQGVTSGNVSRKGGALTRGEVRELAATYEQMFGAGVCGVPAMYEIGTFFVSR